MGGPSSFLYAKRVYTPSWHKGVSAYSSALTASRVFCHAL